MGVSSAANRACSGVQAALSPAGKPEVAETFSSHLAEAGEHHLGNWALQQPRSVFLGLLLKNVTRQIKQLETQISQLLHSQTEGFVSPEFVPQEGCDGRTLPANPAT